MRESLSNLLSTLQKRVLDEIQRIRNLNIDSLSIVDLLAQQIALGKPFKIDTSADKVYIDDVLVPHVITLYFDKFKLIFKNRFLITFTPFSIPIGKYEKTFVYYDDDQYSELFLNEFENAQLIKNLATYADLQKKINALKNLGYEIS